MELYMKVIDGIHEVLPADEFTSNDAARTFGKAVSAPEARSIAKKLGIFSHV